MPTRIPGDWILLVWADFDLQIHDFLYLRTDEPLSRLLILRDEAQNLEELNRAIYTTFRIIGSKDPKIFICNGTLW
jgi:hypothetical protein